MNRNQAKEENIQENETENYDEWKNEIKTEMNKRKIRFFR